MRANVKMLYWLTLGYVWFTIGSHEGTCADIDLSTPYSVDQY